MLNKAFLNFWYQDCVYSPSNLVWKYVARSLLSPQTELTRDFANLYVGCEDEGPSDGDYQQARRNLTVQQLARSSGSIAASYLDTDGDGFLTRVEFDEKVTSLLKMVFDALDQSGGVVEANFENLFRLEFLLNLFDELGDLADTDNDGYITLQPNLFCSSSGENQEQCEIISGGIFSVIDR